ncbi:MAG: hypothetical protein IJQ58_05525, partial [Synergistaceae bacterium]|nr:hypothetical protein [Synergistaceae bacterium]
QEEWNSVYDMLRAFGVHIYSKDIKLKKLCKKLGIPYQDCWYIVNDNTQARYEKDWSKYSGIRAKEEILMHGSPGKNWISIICNGLQHGIVQTTDSGWFGKGIYFGSNNSTSYNFPNSDHSVYKSLNLARVGKQDEWRYREVRDGISSTQLNKKYLDSKGFDSVIGNGHEVVLYDPAQTTIYALAKI